MRIFLLTFSFLVLTGTFIFTSCGGGGGGGSESTVPPATTITSTEDAEEALSSSTLLIAPQNSIDNMFNGNTQSALSTQIINPTSSIEISSSKKAFIPAGLAVYMSKKVKKYIFEKRLNAQQSQDICTGEKKDCSDGGTWSCSGDINEQDEIYDITFEYDDCKYEDVTIDGKGSFKGNKNDGYTFKVDSNFNIQDSSVDITVLQTLTIYGKYSENNNGTEGTGIISINGKIRATDKSTTPNIIYESTFKNFKNSIAWKEIDNSSENKEDITMTTDGTISYSETDGNETLSLEYRFYSFKRNSTIDYNNHTESLSVDGKVYIDYTPDVCFEGTYEYSTLNPIVYDYWTDEFKEGIIKINGAEYRFFTEEGITKVEITINGNSEIKQLDELEGMCSI